MPNTPEINTNLPSGTREAIRATSDDKLSHLAFDNSILPNIICLVSTGEIIMANAAACKMLGYGKKELLTKTRSSIFDSKEKSFRLMLKQGVAEGQATATVTVIKKTGKRISCELTTAIFTGQDGIETAIITMMDKSGSIHKQKIIDKKRKELLLRIYCRHRQ